MRRLFSFGGKVPVALLLVMGGGAPAWSGEAAVAATTNQLTYVELIHRLTDLERLATLPAPGERTAQFSSYDRASRYDEKSRKYVAWDANGDGDGFIRKEAEGLVLAEMEGPGCLWRIWSAAPKSGRVRVFLDGDTNAVVDLPFADYFSGRESPFTRSNLVYTVAQGWNNYTPIPYQKSCKIVAEPGWGQYYHFGYTTFPEGTEVPTFRRELSAAENAALDAADQRLGSSAATPTETTPGQVTLTRELRLEGGRSVVVTNLIGPRAITALRIKLDASVTPDDLALMRELVLQINWDGESSPSVWVPLADFFGTAPGAKAYRSLPLGQADDGWWYCHWFMPFASNAVIRLVNEGDQPRNVSFAVDHAPLTQPVERYARFHAKWHRDEFLPTAVERQIDWPLLKTQGRGRFVGVLLHVWNPRGGWWGEGDEKFFVDGEKFPSTFGTGSEDYFGYAWCDPTEFQRPYHSQVHNDGRNRGHIAVNRWHISDQIPFQKSFAGFIEKYFSDARPTRYASTVYWYLAPGGHDPYSAVPVERRTGYFTQPERHSMPGVVEGETLNILRHTGGQTQEQDMTPFGEHWSNEEQLWWTGAKPGDKLELALPVAEAGRFKLSAQFTQAVDYGIAQLYLNGEKLGEPRDFYNDGVVATGEMDLGVYELTAGEQQLTVEIIGTNPKALPRHMFGLDYVKLTPWP